MSQGIQQSWTLIGHGAKGRKELVDMTANHWVDLSERVPCRTRLIIIKEASVFQLNCFKIHDIHDFACGPSPNSNLSGGHLQGRARFSSKWLRRCRNEHDGQYDLYKYCPNISRRPCSPQLAHPYVWERAEEAECCHQLRKSLWWKFCCTGAPVRLVLSTVFWAVDGSLDINILEDLQ